MICCSFIIITALLRRGTFFVFVFSSKGNLVVGEGSIWHVIAQRKIQRKAATPDKTTLIRPANVYNYTTMGKQRWQPLEPSHRQHKDMRPLFSVSAGRRWWCPLRSDLLWKGWRGLSKCQVKHNHTAPCECCSTYSGHTFTSSKLGSHFFCVFVDAGFLPTLYEVSRVSGHCGRDSCRAAVSCDLSVWSSTPRVDAQQAGCAHYCLFFRSSSHLSHLNKTDISMWEALSCNRAEDSRANLCTAAAGRADQTPPRSQYSANPVKSPDIHSKMAAIGVLRKKLANLKVYHKWKARRGQVARELPSGSWYISKVWIILIRSKPLAHLCSFRTHPDVSGPAHVWQGRFT